MEKTLEALFLKNYEELQNQLELANKKIVELMQKKEEVEEKPVFFKTFSKEVCRIEVASYYEMKDVSFIKEMNSIQVKEIIDNKEKLIEYSEKEYERNFWSKDKFLKLKFDTFPYTAIIRGKCILFDLYYDNDDCRAYILGDKRQLKQDTYYDIKEKNRLYEFGLEQLKKEFQRVYEYKLKKEKEEQKEQEEK